MQQGTGAARCRAAAGACRSSGGELHRLHGLGPGLHAAAESVQVHCRRPLVRRNSHALCSRPAQPGLTWRAFRLFGVSGSITMMVLGQCSPKRCRSGVIEGMEHWGGSDEVTLPTSIVATQVEPTASCSVPHPLCALGLAVRDTSPPALQTVLDASKDAHQSVERATIALPSSATEDSRQKSMQRVLVRASNLTPPKVLLHRAPGSVPSPTGFACSPECLGDQHQHESPSWSAPSPGEPKVLAEPSNDFVSSYDPAGWPAGDAQHLSPAYDLSTACAELNSLESSDDTSDNPPVYPKSDWRALELCVNQPNATWIGATLVGETRDHQCRLIIAETGAEMKVRQPRDANLSKLQKSDLCYRRLAGTRWVCYYRRTRPEFGSITGPRQPSTVTSSRRSLLCVDL